jgi:hypothetical protein
MAGDAVDRAPIEERWATLVATPHWALALAISHLGGDDRTIPRASTPSWPCSTTLIERRQPFSDPHPAR